MIDDKSPRIEEEEEKDEEDSEEGSSGSGSGGGMKAGKAGGVQGARSESDQDRNFGGNTRKILENATVAQRELGGMNAVEAARAGNFNTTRAQIEKKSGHMVGQTEILADPTLRPVLEDSGIRQKMQQSGNQAALDNAEKGSNEAHQARVQKEIDGFLGAIEDLSVLDPMQEAYLLDKLSEIGIGHGSKGGDVSRGALAALVGSYVSVSTGAQKLVEDGKLTVSPGPKASSPRPHPAYPKPPSGPGF